MESINEEPDNISRKLLLFLKGELKNQAIAYETSLTQIQGGFETLTYRFTLRGVEEKLKSPLILRLYPPFIGTTNAPFESTLQNVLAGEGYPVAKAHFVCTDKSVLGGAFFVMDFLPGNSLMASDPETMPELLGKTHARLHDIDPDVLVKSLENNRIDTYRYSFARQFDWLDKKGEDLPWLGEILDWLTANRPPEPKQLAVCHGDFHPFNILFDNGKITGVIDWPNFNIGDPVHDVATTLMLTAIPGKYHPEVQERFQGADWDQMAERYLSAYQARKPLDMARLPYYQVKRCVKALIEGAEGQAVWQHPPIRKDLIDYIDQTAGVRVPAPENPQ